jgi:Glycosyl hydrolases family 32 N-terminal domain/Stage II sporulation protein E (SpoIIE)
MILNRRRVMKTLGMGTAAEILLSKATRGWSLAMSGAQQTPPHDLAHDPLRPEYHLLPQHNWMNDPNGPIWWKGKYHLFYQLNPHAAVWGDMHWGHAISADMVHWHHEPIALAPTAGGADSEGCFSGSAVVLGSVPTFIYTGVQNAPKDQATLRDGNDKLVLMSDGIVEATDAEGHLFGFERVHKLLHTATTAAAVANAAQSFGQEDDISVIAVTRTLVFEPALASAV